MHVGIFGGTGRQLPVLQYSFNVTAERRFVACPMPRELKRIRLISILTYREPTRKNVQIKFFLQAAFVISVLMFNSCLTQTTYETAKLLKKNQFDLSPSYSGYYLYAKSSEDFKINDNWKNSYGANIGYGISSSFNLYGYYEYSDYPLFSKYGSKMGQNYFQLEPKFEIEAQKSAVSFPVGFSNFDDAKIIQFGAKSFSNIYINRRMFYCLSVSGMATVILEEKIDWGGALFINNIFNYGLPYQFYIRPQLGVDLTTILYSVPLGYFVTSINFGIGIGKEF
jgi:hypothetical protein